VTLLVHSSQEDPWWCNKKHFQGVEEKQPDIFPHINLNTLVNQRRFRAKEEKLSGTEPEQSQANVKRMIQITAAPYEQNLKPFQQTDDHQQPATETTTQEHPTITDTIPEK
jgi:hypothetical protein